MELGVEEDFGDADMVTKMVTEVVETVEAVVIKATVTQMTGRSEERMIVPMDSRMIAKVDIETTSEVVDVVMTEEVATMTETVSVTTRTGMRTLFF